MQPYNRLRLILIILFIVIFIPKISLSLNADNNPYNSKKSQLIKKYESIVSKNSGYSSTQKTIAYAIINILRYSPEKKLDIVDSKSRYSQSEFLSTIKKITDIELRYNNINKQIIKIDKKVDILKGSSNDNNSNNEKNITLQYEFYNITKSHLNNEREYIKNNLNRWKNIAYSIFTKTNFKPKQLKSQLKHYLKRYNELDNSIQKISVEYDKFSLLGKQKEASNIKKTIETQQIKQDYIVKNIIDNYLLIYFSLIKNDKDTLKTLNSINAWINKLRNQTDIEHSRNMVNLAYFIAKKKFGYTKIMIQRIKNNAVYVVVVLWDFIKKPIINIGQTSFSILNLLLSILIFAFGIYIGKIYKLRITTSSFSKNMPISTKTIISNIGYYVIITISIFSGLKIIGINLSSLAVILGALSVGIGFGLQNIVANFISGIILMLENSIRIGDYIEIENDLRGVVKDINIRSTIITTNDNIEIIIPNQTLFQNNVTNWTLTEKIRRFSIDFSVSYGTNIEIVEKVIYESLETSNLNYIKHNKELYPELKMINMSDSSIDLSLDIWVEGNSVIYPRRTKSKFLILIYDTLNKNNITIPFPQMDIHIKEPIKIAKKDNN